MSQDKQLHEIGDISLIIQDKKSMIKEIGKALYNCPNQEKWISYQEQIHDLVSTSVKYWCDVASESKWENIPKLNLYEQATSIEIFLTQIAQALEQENMSLLKESQDRLDAFLDSFFKVE